jgi:hypothetical protein
MNSMDVDMSRLFYQSQPTFATNTISPYGYNTFEGHQLPSLFGHETAMMTNRSHESTSNCTTQLLDPFANETLEFSLSSTDVRYLPPLIVPDEDSSLFHQPLSLSSQPSHSSSTSQDCVYASAGPAGP